MRPQPTKCGRAVREGCLSRVHACGVDINYFVWNAKSNGAGRLWRCQHLGGCKAMKLADLNARRCRSRAIVIAEDFLWQHTQHQGRENLCPTMHPRAPQRTR